MLPTIRVSFLGFSQYVLVLRDKWPPFRHNYTGDSRLQDLGILLVEEWVDVLCEDLVGGSPFVIFIILVELNPWSSTSFTPRGTNFLGGDH